MINFFVILSPLKTDEESQKARSLPVPALPAGRRQAGFASLRMTFNEKG